MQRHNYLSSFDETCIRVPRCRLTSKYGHDTGMPCCWSFLEELTTVRDSEELLEREMGPMLG